jgi:hypothetical protein
MDSVTNLEARLRAVEDRLEIQALAARFSDAVNERDVTALAQLWASDRPIWEIGPPLESRAKGITKSSRCCSASFRSNAPSCR